MLSLESPHRDDSNEYTQYTIFNIKEKITLNFPKYAAMEFFSKGLKNEFKTSQVNEPLKFYCICFFVSFSSKAPEFHQNDIALKCPHFQ